MKSFSYLEYQKIVSYISENLPIIDYGEVDDKTESFAIIRHDVEFIIERAYELALFECEMLGIKSTYFFQMRNNCYNIFSDKNIDLVHKIKSLGHKIGFHAHMDAFGSSLYHKLDNYIINEINTLEKATGFPIDRFSFHRPKKQYLQSNLKIHGIINAYEDKYFTLSDDLLNLDVTYLSDSNHQWKYGYPLDINFNKVRKLQLLIHPFSWTKSGNDNYNNYVSLLDEKIKEIKSSMNLEIKNYPKELL